MTVNIIGAGGHSRSLIPLALKQGLKIKGVYDDNFTAPEKIYQDIQLVGSLADIDVNLPCIIALGNNLIRADFAQKFKVYQPNLIHSTATYDETSLLGHSNQIFAQSYIGSLVRLGHGNIINTHCLIEHESQIGDFNHISVNATLCGRVKIGNKITVGAGAVINPNVSICDQVTIGSGAVVTKDITEPGTYVGVPAKKLESPTIGT